MVTWPVRPNPPFVPGHEGVGIVAKLGAAGLTSRRWPSRSPTSRSAPPAASRQRPRPTGSRCPNVACVGGSWLTPADAVLSRDGVAVTTLAREAVSLLPTPGRGTPAT